MQPHSSICSVIVTFNRLDALKQVVHALKQQTRPVDRILVINNNSMDGTEAWLREQAGLTYITQANTGGAGGFHTGVKAALESGADWVWLMDDDVAPRPACLEELLRYRSLSDCLQPVRLEPGGSLLDEEQQLDYTRCRIGGGCNLSYKSGKAFWFRNTGCFEGMLIAASLVRKIGLPDPRFFLMHDDLAYGYLASRHTNILVVAAARLQKLPPAQSNPGYGALYYGHRNLWLVNTYLDADTPELSAYRRRCNYFHFLQTAWQIIRYGEYHSRSRALGTLWKAFLHYRQKKTGHTF